LLAFNSSIEVSSCPKATALLDSLNSNRPVAVGPRKNDSRRVMTVRFGQRPKENIDRASFAVLGLKFRQLQPPVNGGEILAGRDHIHVIGMNGLRLLRLDNSQAGRALQNRGERTFVFRGQMHHNHENDAAIRRHGLEEPTQRRESSRRSPQAYHGESLVRAGKSDFLDHDGASSSAEHFRHDEDQHGSP
jgi:hypothetical protein